MYTYFVKTNIITLERLIELMSFNARKRFNIPIKNNDYSIWQLDEKIVVNPKDFLSLGKAMPFEGYELYGKCYLTVCGGKTVYKEDLIYNQEEVKNG